MLAGFIDHFIFPYFIFPNMNQGLAALHNLHEIESSVISIGLDLSKDNGRSR